MSDIPPERRSTHELYEQLRVAGERRARADRAARRHRRLRAMPGPALGAVLAFLVVGGGAAVGTRALTADDGTTRSGDGARSEVREAPADRRLARATAADPEVAGERWGLLTYQNTAGATCAVPGRLLDGRVGVVGGGRFEAYGASPPGATCGRSDSEPLLLFTRFVVSGDGARGVLYGIADRSVTALRLLGDARPVPIAPDGTFLVVAPGREPFRGRTLRVTRGGARRDIEL